MKVTIEAVNRSQKETVHGIKPQIGIKISETTVKDVNGTDISVSERWLNSYNVAGTDNWDKGMSVNVDIVEKDGKWLNFKPAVAPQVDTELVARVEKLEASVFGERDNDSF